MNKTYLFIFICFIGCGRGPKSYVEWYNSVEPTKVEVEEGTVLVKEVTPELLYIQLKEDVKRKNDLKSFLDKINVQNISFEFKPNQTGVDKPLYGKNLECSIDGIPPLDILPELSSKGIPLKVTMVFDKKVFTEGKQIEIAHPQIKQVIKQDLKSIKISNKKELSI